MFSPDIVCSDAFLEMAPSTQALYYHLGMRADDDGFVNPKFVMRVIGSTDDELKMLIVKKFVLPFENGVIVIKHWRINNFVRKDRYKPTLYLPEKAKLLVKPNQSYSFNDTDGALPIAEVPWKSDSESYGQPMVNQWSTQVRLGKVSTITEQEVREVREEEEKPYKPDKRVKEKLSVFHLWGQEPKVWWKSPAQRVAALHLIDTVGFEQVAKAVSIVKKYRDEPYCPSINTPTQLAEKWESLLDFKERNKIKWASKNTNA